MPTSARTAGFTGFQAEATTAGDRTFVQVINTARAYCLPWHPHSVVSDQDRDILCGGNHLNIHQLSMCMPQNIGESFSEDCNCVVEELVGDHKVYGTAQRDFGGRGELRSELRDEIKDPVTSSV